MTTLPPTLARIAQDRTGPRAALHVVILLVHAGLLGPDYRRIKQSTISHVTGLSQQQCSTALRWLIQRGHIQRINEPFVGALYRLSGDA